MQLKIANVVPIYKTGNEHVFSNFRPVSVLPFFSKLLEKLMYNRLMDFITRNKLLYKHQFGFQKGKSTNMALMLLIDKITKALDNGNCVVGIYLDFSKAFDIVNHDIVLQKLSMYGVQDIALETFMHQCIHKQAPEMFFNLFHTNSHFHDTRHSVDLHVPYGRIDVRQFSIKIHGVKLWNSLPDQIENAQFI